MMNEWIVSSSLLIAAVLVGRRLLRGKISLRLQYALWEVVLIRLLLPVQFFTSSIGAGSMAQSVDLSEPVRQVYTSAREDDYERAYDAAYSEAVAEYLASGQNYDPVTVERTAAQQARRAMELDLNKLLWGGWFAGMVVMTSVIASCNVHLGLQLKRRRWELPVSDSILPVYITEAVPTPCIFGLFRPAIYLTPDAAGEGSVRDHVLAHELTHYRHLDHIWSVLRSVCLILHWYNPLVWIAARVSRADAELACDEGALEKLGEEHRADYGRTLIGLTCPDHGASMFVTATTMTGSAGSIRERIRLLMKRPRNTVLALIAVVLIGTIIVGCTFAGAPETSEPTETTTPTETTEPTGHAPDQDMSYHGQELPIAGTTDPAESTPQGVDNDMSYHGQELPIPENPGGTTPVDDSDLAGEIMALFDEDADPSCRAALTRLYDYLEEPIEYSDEDLFVPQFTEIVKIAENDVDVYYRRPGDFRLYVANMYYIDGEGWYISCNRMVVTMDDYGDLNPRTLTEQEMAQFRSVFNTLNADGEINPAACFLVNYYEDVTRMSRRDFMAYFPGSTEGTEKEFKMLKAKYPDFFEGWTWEDMPIPIHCYEPKKLNSVLQKFADMRWEDLPDDGTHYLEQTDRFYNYTSDFGLGGFAARSGFVYDGGAVILGDWAALIFAEIGGEYFVRAYVPAVIPTHSSHPMLPAEP